MPTPRSPAISPLASFTLPFGIRSLAYLYKTHARQQGSQHKEKPSIQFNAPEFDNDLKGGIQLKLSAGSAPKDDQSNMFRGFTLQMNNVLDLNGQPTGTTTLGEDVAKIFNREFFKAPTNIDEQRGVPLTRIDVSGYGASTLQQLDQQGRAVCVHQPGAVRRHGRAHRARSRSGQEHPVPVGHTGRAHGHAVRASAAATSIDSTPDGRRRRDGKFDFRFRHVTNADDVYKNHADAHRRDRSRPTRFILAR